MADGIYIAMNGAAARLQQLDAIADNLANAETPGFRAERPTFSAVLADHTRPHAPGYTVATHAVDERPGEARVTSRPLDVRVDEHAWLAVELADGSVAYTKDGRLDLDADGRLLAGGRPVLGRAGDITTPPGAQIAIGADGTITADGKAIDQLAIVELAPGAERIAPSLVRGDAHAIEAPRVHVGELEGSNARALESTVELVAAQRAYDHAMQAIQTSRRLDERASEVARLR
jgi:flagellar basal-body rod protein FlgF